MYIFHLRITLVEVDPPDFFPGENNCAVYILEQLSDFSIYESGASSSHLANELTSENGASSVDLYLLIIVSFRVTRII